MKKFFSILCVAIFVSFTFIVSPSCTNTEKSVSDSTVVDTVKIDSTKVVDSITKVK